MAKDKKELNKKSLKELKKMRAEAKKAGKDKRVKKLSSAIKKKRSSKPTKSQKKANQELREQVYSSELYAMLTPDQKRTFEAAVNSYVPSGVKTTKLSKAERKAIADSAAKIVNPEYDEAIDDITAAHEEQLSTKIESTQTELSRLDRDLNTALANNDTYTAEQVKLRIEDAKTSIADLEQERNITVQRHREHLETAVKDIQTTLGTTLGRAGEDEIVQLRQLERLYTNNLKTLKKNMVNRGYTWSTERRDDEAELAEVDVESRTTTKREAERRREDARDTARTGTRDAQTFAKEGIEDVERETAQNIAGYLRGAETQVGTQYILDKLGKQYGESLVGEVEGALMRSQRLIQEQETKGFERTTQGRLTGFADSYGSEKAKEEFGGFEGFAGLDIKLPEDRKGESQRLYEESIRDTEQGRKGLLESTEEELKGLYKEGIRI